MGLISKPTTVEEPVPELNAKAMAQPRRICFDDQRFHCRIRTSLNRSSSRTVTLVSDNSGVATVGLSESYAIKATAPYAIAEDHLAAALALVQADCCGGRRVDADCSTRRDACRLGGCQEDGDVGEEGELHRKGFGAIAQDRTCWVEVVVRSVCGRGW